MRTILATKLRDYCRAHFAVYALALKAPTVSCRNVWRCQMRSVSGEDLTYTSSQGQSQDFLGQKPKTKIKKSLPLKTYLTQVMTSDYNNDDNHRRNNRTDRERLVPQTFRLGTKLVPQLLGRSFQKARNCTASSHQNAGCSI